MFEKWRQRRKLEREPFPKAWRDLIAANLAHWRVLDAEERERLEDTVFALMLYKNWEAARGFVLTDEVRVTIAAHAALLTLGFEEDDYRNVETIIVHPTTMQFDEERVGPAGTRTRTPEGLLGRSYHQRGPVMIAWETARFDARHPERGHNVVYHEFAHKLDLLDDAADGIPPLETSEERERWSSVVADEYERLRREPDPLLDDYGTTDPAEFFAVVTEVFFDRPVVLEADKPELYGVLRDFYRQDPAARERRASTA